MVKFSNAFNISKSQSELDFVDIDLSKDTPLYLDPYAIQIRNDEWSAECGDNIRSYFNAVLDSLRADDMNRAKHLLSHLREPNETYLGQSKGLPSGRGIGPNKSALLANALVNSRAFETGLLTDISEAQLFIPDVGPDTISDLTTNILRHSLAKYTNQQCQLHGIQTRATNQLGPIWNPIRRDWEARSLNLPIYENQPILLVPKFSVRFKLSIDTQEFYNHYMIEFFRQEYLSSGGALVQVFKNGNRDVYKKDVKEIHPLIKDDLADFVRAHPEVLEMYKNLKGSEGTMSLQDFDAEFDDRVFAEVLKARLLQIEPGNITASEYHSVSMGICTFLFYPGLICPVKEQEIHEGRKRIDIKYTNSTEGRFFKRVLEAPQTRAINIFVECKNFTKEIANPELDQLSGRFGHQRGFLGFLFCRTLDNRTRIIERCKDAAQDGRGFMLVFEDRDLVKLLDFVSNNRRPEIDSFLTSRLDEITH